MMYSSFSVAMSVYQNDNALFFEKALESITALQTRMPDEIVLVVDGPVSEEINHVIAEYEATYGIFRVIRLPKNGGLGNALKIAVDAAENEFIARMDSDDIALPGRFEEQLRKFAEDPELDIVGGNIAEFADTQENILAYRNVPVEDSAIKEYLKVRCPFNHSTVMYKKSAVLRAGGYRDLFCNEDYYLWIRMFEHGCKMGNTGTVLVNVRIGAAMYQRRGGKRYFQSEKFLQDYMRKREIISLTTYLLNLSKRLVVQILLPSGIRGWVFRKFARNEHVRIQ